MANTKMSCVLSPAMLSLLLMMMMSGRRVAGAAVNHYCVNVLEQTKENLEACTRAPEKYKDSSKDVSIYVLFCCLGVITDLKPKIDYTPYLDITLFAHIWEKVTNDDERKEVSVFIKKCHKQLPAVISPGNESKTTLNAEDYRCWQQNSSSCFCPNGGL